MGLIDRLKRMFPGVTSGPVEHAPVHTEQQLDVDAEFSIPARNLLKEATALKRAKRYDEAVAMLRRAYDAPGESHVTLLERLRLPMYLQLAGRADEGWAELNRLNITYVDQSSQISIAAVLAEFLRKEGKYKGAAMWTAWVIFKMKEADVDFINAVVHSADQAPSRALEREALGLPSWPWSTPPTGTTPSGNPIHNVAYPSFHRRLTEDYGEEAIRANLERDLAKVVASEIISALVTNLSSYLAKEPPYDIGSVRRIFAKHLA